MCSAIIPLTASASSDDRRYLCIPPAGGTVAVFRELVGAASARAVWGVEYPGRGERFAEPLPDALEDLAEQLAEEVVGLFGLARVGRTVLVGFSLGGVLALEMAQRMSAEWGVAPVALVVVGVPAPQRRVRGRFDERDAASLLAGCGPGAGLESPELWEYAVELLQGDLRLAAAYRGPGVNVAPCPVVALCGSGDRTVVAVEDATEAWREWATGRFMAGVLAGGHLEILDPGRGAELWGRIGRFERCLDQAGDNAVSGWGT